MALGSEDDIPAHRFKDGAYGKHPYGLSPETLSALTGEFGPTFKFFEMQTAVISHLLHASRVQRTGDVVLRSPTGSGKTLAFAIPIIERLRRRAIPRLRAVIIVPTHDLATQVHAVFRMLADTADIAVALATGATSVASEAASAAHAEVLIATPGRLVDHVDNTPGVTLAHVEYLVLDESDRLLQDAFYGWADVVVPQCGVASCAGVLSLGITTGTQVMTKKILVSATATRDPQRIAKLRLQRVRYFEPAESEARALKKREDEEKTIGDEGGYTVPQGLSECAYVLTSPRDKPMALLSILGWRSGASAATPVPRHGSKLVFTKSVQAAHRLARLLELFASEQEGAPIVLEISREVAPRRREEVLAMLNASEGQKEREVIVVCSDVFARGIDIPSIEAVISYDAPARIHSYLHRVGRAARAGRPGSAVTLLLAKQVRHFKGMVRDIDRGEKKCRFRDLDVKAGQVGALLLSRHLHALRRVLRRESLGLLNTGEVLPGYLLSEMKVDDEAVAKARSKEEDGPTPAKRARLEEPNDAKQEEEEAEHSDVESSIGDDNSDIEEDSFNELLTAQVAFNWLRQTN